MIALAWWSMPLFVWLSLIAICVVVAHMDVIGVELAAAALFLAGTFACGSLALCCWLMRS